MFVAVMALVMSMFVAMDRRLVAMLMAVVDMGLGPMGVFVLMFLFAVATHAVSPPFHDIFNILTLLLLRSNPDLKKWSKNRFGSQFTQEKT